MKILSIEPTPSPNTMKLNMDEKLPDGVRNTYTLEQKSSCPDYIVSLLHIPDVRSVFHAADFIAIERKSKGSWQRILAQAREALGEEAPAVRKGAPSGTGQGNGSRNGSAHADSHSYAGDKDKDAAQPAADQPDEAFGEATVLVQTFKGIPMQVRVRSGTEEARLALPERFAEAALRAQASSPNLIMERKLEEKGVRYGDLNDIAEQIVQEIDAAYDDERLNRLVTKAFEKVSGKLDAAADADSDSDMDGDGGMDEGIDGGKLSGRQLAEILRHPDWKVRYAALDMLKPSIEQLPNIIGALRDEHSSIRRLAAVYLGDIKEPEVLPYLFQALKDASVTVRRTAGDCLSDIGDPAAIGPMAEALKDRNKLVRWRAARFLYEAGDETALSALEEAEDDPEFEVSFQVRIALERIKGGEAAEGSVWQQMTRRKS